MARRIRSDAGAVRRSKTRQLSTCLALGSLLTAGCTSTDATTSTADDPATPAVAEEPDTTDPDLPAADLPDVTVSFDPAPGTDRWDLVGIGDSFLGWTTVTEQYADLLGDELGIDITVEKIVNPTSNRLEHIRSDDRAAELLAEAEIVVVEPQPGPPSAPAWNRYFAGECGGTDDQECMRTAQADFARYVGDLFDELIAMTPEDTTIVATLVGTWGVEAFNPGLEEDDPEAYRIFVEHVVALQDISATAAAARGIATVDVSAEFSGPGYDQPVPDGYLEPDRTHLTDEGSLAVARLLHELSHPADDEPDPDGESVDATPTGLAPIADDGTGVALEWIHAELPGDGPFTLLEHGGTGFVLADNLGRWYTSSDGLEWEAVALDGDVPPLDAGPWVPHPVVAFDSTVTLAAADTPIVVVDVESGRVDRSDEGFIPTGFGPVVASGALGTVVVDGSGVDGSGSPRAWFSGDGIDWEEIPSAGPFGRPARARVAAIDDGFVALVANETDGTNGNFLREGNELWFSADGIAWELRDAAVELPFFPQALLPWREGAVAVWSADWDSPSPSTDGLVLVTADTASFVSVDDIADLDAFADQSPAHVDTGPLGIAYAYTLDVLNTRSEKVDGPFHLVEFSADGVHWSRRTLPSGIGRPQRVAVGSSSVAVLTSTLGNPPWGSQSLWIGTPTS